MSYASWLGPRLRVQRTFGPHEEQAGEAEEELFSGQVGNVIILVHGIGEKMWSEEGAAA